eukprot:UN09632
MASIGIVLYKNLENFNAYCTYSNNYTKQLDNYGQNLISFPKFNHFIRTVEESRLINISSLLILPVQRIPKYYVLLKRLQQIFFKITPHTFQPKRLEDSLDALHRLTSMTNSALKQNYDNQMTKIQTQWFNNKIRLP